MDLLALANEIAGKTPPAAQPEPTPAPVQHEVLSEVLATMPEVTAPPKPRVSAAVVAAHIALQNGVAPTSVARPANVVALPQVPAAPAPDQQYAGWHTYEEWQALGFQVQAGEHSTRVFSRSQVRERTEEDRPQRAPRRRFVRRRYY